MKCGVECFLLVVSAESERALRTKYKPPMFAGYSMVTFGFRRGLDSYSDVLVDCAQRPGVSLECWTTTTLIGLALLHAARCREGSLYLLAFNVA